ncbi:MAG TPA: hypothetical protein VM145_05830 [Sphingomicrobium sp.]|nr:hypothetical protein [Sphingomicrobium sp.]
MRKFVISLAAAGAALVVASPAAAQYYPQQQPYGYAGHGGYGFNNGYGQLRSLQQRIDRIQYRIEQLDRRHAGRGNSAKSLRKESRSIERRLRDSGRNGLNPYEVNDITNRVARLEQRVNYALANRGRGYGNAGYSGYKGSNGYNSGGYHGDRGHDGDRYDGRDDDRDDHHGYDRDDD